MALLISGLRENYSSQLRYLRRLGLTAGPTIRFGNLFILYHWERRVLRLMQGLVNQVRALNRKESFYLVGLALDNRAFKLGQEFRESLKERLGLDVPEDAFVAMDYHLSWLYAATILAADQGRSKTFLSGGGIDRGNQEDVDLIVAYDEGPVTNVLVLEAKGVTSFSNGQLQSKVERLKLIFGAGDEGDALPSVRPHFAIVSPLRPLNVRTEDWPGWMKRHEGQPEWIRMQTPSELLKITRCDAAGRTDAKGGHWKAEPDRIIGRQERAKARAADA